METTEPVAGLPEAAPSSQLYDVIPSSSVEERPSKVQTARTHDEVNRAMGGASVTATRCDELALCPLVSITVSVTVYVPGVAKVFAGATTLPAVEPSPNVHERDAMPTSSLDPALVKLQVSPAQPQPKLAKGGISGGAVTVTFCDVEALCPAASVTVSVTVYVPTAA